MKKESVGKSTSKKKAASGKQTSTTKTKLRFKTSRKPEPLEKHDASSIPQPEEKALPAGGEAIVIKPETLPASVGDDHSQEETLKESRSQDADISLSSMATNEDSGYKTYEPKQKLPEKPAFNYAAPEQTKGSDSMKRSLPYLIVGFIVLIGFLLVYSLPNANKFYIKKSGEGIKILQGTFSPLGKKVLVDLPGAQAPDPIRNVYSRDEAYSVICHYYLTEAENVLTVSGTANIDTYKAFVLKAQAFASTDALQKAVKAHSNDINLMALLYKADISASKGTAAGVEEAMKYVNQAAALELDERQTRLIEYKIKTFNDLDLLLKLSE